MVTSIILSGTAMGCIYALIGITYNVMFSASRVFSFTAGTLGMLGGVLGSLFIARMGMPVAVGLLLVLAGGAVLAVAVVVSALVLGPGVWADFLALPGQVSDPVTTPGNLSPGALAYTAGVSREAATAVQWASTLAAAVAPPPPEPVAPAASSPALIPGSSTAHLIDVAQVQGQVHAQSVHRVGELAERNPNETVAIVRQWLNEIPDPA